LVVVLAGLSGFYRSYFTFRGAYSLGCYTGLVESIPLLMILIKAINLGFGLLDKSGLS